MNVTFQFWHISVHSSSPVPKAVASHGGTWSDVLPLAALTSICCWAQVLSKSLSLSVRNKLFILKPKDWHIENLCITTNNAVWHSVVSNLTRYIWLWKFSSIWCLNSVPVGFNHTGQDQYFLLLKHAIPSKKWYMKGKKVKGEAIPLQAWIGPEGSRRLRLPDFKTISTQRW